MNLTISHKKIPFLLTDSAGGCFIFRYKHVNAKYTGTALVEEQVDVKIT